MLPSFAHSALKMWYKTPPIALIVSSLVSVAPGDLIKKILKMIWVDIWTRFRAGRQTGCFLIGCWTREIRPFYIITILSIVEGGSVLQVWEKMTGWPIVIHSAKIESGRTASRNYLGIWIWYLQKGTLKPYADKKEDFQMRNCRGKQEQTTFMAASVGN